MERGWRLLNDLFTVSDPAGQPHETGGGGEQGEGEWGPPGKVSRGDWVFLATDSQLLKETAASRVHTPNVRVVTSPFPVVHSAGAGACGDSSECEALAANTTALEQVQVVGHAARALISLSLAPVVRRSRTRICAGSVGVAMGEGGASEGGRVELIDA